MRRYVILGSIIAAIALGSSASADAPDLSGADQHWLQDETQHCWAYLDQVKFQTKARWTGACKDQIADGKGTFAVAVWDQPFVTITGVFSGGKLNGTGEIAYADGAFQRGTFKDGKQEGAGKRRWSSGDTYEGTFHDGVPDGSGAYMYYGGARYTGSVRAGKFDGQGVWTMQTGGVLSGTFAASKPVGIFEYRAPDGTTRKGEVTIPHNDPAFPVLPTKYPDMAERLGLEGRVWVEFTVGIDGRASDAVLSQSSGRKEFDDAAMAAAPTWRMIPATVGGEPIPFRATRAVTFKIQD